MQARFRALFLNLISYMVLNTDIHLVEKGVRLVRHEVLIPTIATEEP